MSRQVHSFSKSGEIKKAKGQRESKNQRIPWFHKKITSKKSKNTIKVA